MIFLSIVLIASTTLSQTEGKKATEPVDVRTMSDAERLGIKGPVKSVRTGFSSEITFDDLGRLMQERQTQGCYITEDFRHDGLVPVTMFRHNVGDPGGNNYCSTRYGQLIRYLKVPDPRANGREGILFNITRTVHGDRNAKTGKFEWLISYLVKAGDVNAFRRNFRFDEAGRLIEEHEVDFDLTDRRTVNYYDGERSAPSRTEVLIEGRLASSFSFEYLEFDKYGNWTKRRERVEIAGGGGQSSETTRSITYRN